MVTSFRYCIDRILKGRHLQLSGRENWQRRSLQSSNAPRSRRNDSHNRRRTALSTGRRVYPCAVFCSRRNCYDHTVNNACRYMAFLRVKTRMTFPCRYRQKNTLSRSLMTRRRIKIPSLRGRHSSRDIYSTLLKMTDVLSFRHTTIRGAPALDSLECKRDFVHSIDAKLFAFKDSLSFEPRDGILTFVGRIAKEFALCLFEYKTVLCVSDPRICRLCNVSEREYTA